MHISSRIPQSPSPSRNGLTVLEFVGCLIAVGGGLWLGALYLGVDVPNATYNALSKSRLLDKMPEAWRPAPPTEIVQTREQLVTTLNDEFSSLRTQVTALRTGSTLNPSVNASAVMVSPDIKSPTKEHTLAYWLQLSETVLTVTALQSEAESTLNADNAAKVFALKGQISRFAAKAVEAIPTTSVDDIAVRFGRTLGFWYDRSGELCEEATRIWEMPISPQARAQMNQAWRQAEEHHRNEARLLHQKGASARSSLNRIYGEEFPEFAPPIEGESN